MLIIVSTVFRQLIQKVLLGLGPRIGFELVKATKVVEGMASEIHAVSDYKKRSYKKQRSIFGKI